MYEKRTNSCDAQNSCFDAGPCHLVEFIVINTSVILINVKKTSVEV